MMQREIRNRMYGNFEVFPSAIIVILILMKVLFNK